MWLLLTLLPGLYGQNNDVKELKKEAEKRFAEENYDGAYKLYAQLVANYPKDAEYSYRLGVCMIYSEPDKKKCIPYLRKAVENEQESPKEVWFYLGKSYHINYRFDEAIKHYNKFKEVASSSLQKKLEVDREIEACRNGKKLLSNMSDLVVQNKKVLNEGDYFRSYEVKNLGGKLLVKPDEFKTSLDKKKKDRTVMFLPREGNKVFFSSYGDKGDNGRDIYMAYRTAAGGFSKPQPVTSINTPYDDDYPWLHPDGRTLYFASKGHNSMGGYDIFKSVFIEATQAWSPPINLEFPINSPDDDFLFVTDSLGEIAFFSTGRQSPPGKIDVLKIKTARKPIDVIVIAGTVEAENEGQSVESTITVKNTATNKEVGMFAAEPTGEYNMELPNGAKLLFTVATPGLTTQSQEIQLPLAQNSAAFSQKITYENGKLRIINDFDSQPKEDDYLKLLAVIEKKARLEVNEGENDLEIPVATASGQEKQPEENQEKTKAEPAEENSPAKTMDNRELAKMARQDAEESQLEATQLEKDASEAMRAGKEQKLAADKKMADANSALEAASQIADPDEREAAILDAEKLQAEARSEQLMAEKVVDVARSLEEDAALHKQKAALNRQYADELDKIVVSANPASLKKIEELKQRIEKLEEKKGVSQRIAETKRSLAQKEEQASQIESSNNALRTDLSQLSSSITAMEQELEKTRKKSKREQIQADLENLKAERDDKQKEFDNNETDLAAIREEITVLESELQVTEALSPASREQVAGTQENNKEKSQVANQAPAEKPEETAKPADNDNIVSTPTQTKIVVPEAKSTATTQQQAIQKLDDIAKAVSFQNTPGEIATTDFSSDEARQKSEEAGRLFENLQEQRIKLQSEIAAARSVVSGNGPATASPEEAERLSSEAETLSTRAHQLRTEARELEGNAREQKLQQARELEEQANDKLIESAAVTAILNKREFETGSRNLDKLIANGKGTQEEREQALMLSGEADLVLEQAADLRAEAARLPTKGAQLGSLSNAEEREAEALLKQKQAIELLKAKNPEVQLEDPVSSAPGTVTAVNPDAVVADINQRAKAIQQLETEAYSKLYEANEAELRSLQERMATSELQVRSEAEQLLSEAADLKEKSATASGEQEKSELIAAAVKKQESAIAQFRKLETELNQSIASNEEQKPAVTTNTVSTEAPQKPESAEPTEPLVSNTNPTTERTEHDTSVSPPVVKTTTLQGLVQNTVKDQDQVMLNNLNETLGKLAVTEKELEKLNNNTAGLNEEQIEQQVEQLNAEAESEQRRAQEKRNVANSLEGEVKEEMLKEAGELEQSATNKQIEAILLTSAYNAASITNADSTISTLLRRAENDDPQIASQLRSELEEIANLRNQVTSLREEAESMENAGQKLGVLSNVAEKEDELLEKLREMSGRLTTKYPDHVQTDYAGNSANIESKRKQLEQQQEKLLEEVAAITLRTYDARKTQDFARLNANQQRTKKEAETERAQADRLLAEAQKTNNRAQKLEKTEEAIRLAASATVKLRSLPARTEGVAATQSDATRTNANARGTARVEGLEVIRGSAYHANKPIPINAPIANGLTFRVQIGAFRTRLPDNAFGGLSPLNGETTSSGYYRYTAGNFNKIENANAVKNDLRNLGYSDAFVVAYYNGKRISIAEALDLMAAEGRSVDPAAPSSAGITVSSNVPRPATVAPEAPATITKELNETNGLLYTIQIGVFNRQVSAGKLRNLLPVYRERLGNGLYRYTAGIYNNPERLLADKQKVVAIGIRDAFVSAYINGKRVPFAEARNRQQNDASIRMEAENPIIFPGTAPAQLQPTETTPFTNNIKEYPAPTAENGVKTTEEGITYKVQIGAFSKQIPSEVAARFSQIKNWPVEYKQVNNLYVYTVGNFSEARFARTLRDEVVRLGISDAFIAVYRDGKKLYGAEAAELLNR